MRLIRKYLPVLLVLMLYACSNTFILFKHPQPIDEKNLDEFPDELIGRYLSSESNPFEDSSVLVFEKKAIVEMTWAHGSLALKDSSNTAEIENRKHAKSKHRYSSYNVTWVEMNDSFYYCETKITQYPLGKVVVLREGNGKYFLNVCMRSKQRRKETLWLPVMLALSSDKQITLSMAMLNGHPDPTKPISKDSAGNLVCMTDSGALRYFSQFTSFETAPDSSCLIIDPSRPQLDKLIDAGLFEPYKQYKKE